MCSLVVLVALAVTAAAHAAPAPTEAEYHKLCRSIHPAHVRALFTGAVAPIQVGGTSDCGPSHPTSWSASAPRLRS